MQINPPIEPMPTVDIGKLIMETVTNSKHITPAMQNAVAQYVTFTSQPVRIVKPIKVQG